METEAKKLGLIDRYLTILPHWIVGYLPLFFLAIPLLRDKGELPLFGFSGVAVKLSTVQVSVNVLLYLAIPLVAGFLTSFMTSVKSEGWYYPNFVPKISHITQIALLSCKNVGQALLLNHKGKIFFPREEVICEYGYTDQTK